MNPSAHFDPNSEARHVLATVLGASDDAIITSDLEGVVASWNGGAESLYGYTADEMIGRSMAVLIPSGLSDDLGGVLQRIKSGGRIEWHEATKQTRDGRQVDVSLMVLPVSDASGRVVGAV